MAALVGADSVSSEPAVELTEEEAKFLELREKLKAAKRERIGKETGSCSCPALEYKKVDNYGSFFGPSTPSISRRLLSKEIIDALLHNAQIAKRSSATITSKPNLGPKQSTHTRSQKLKESRDYSFLFSDDQEPKLSTQESATSKQSTNTDNEKASNIHQSQPTPGLLEGSPATTLVSTSPQPQAPVRPNNAPLISKTQSTKTAIKLRMEQKKQIQEPNKLKLTKKKLSGCEYGGINDKERSRISSVIQGIFSKGRKRRVRIDDSDSDGECMEATFQDIQKEERNSDRVAREEDRIELLRIKQEGKSD